MHDLVVRGGTVIDGSGAPPFEADVAVRDGRVVEVGSVGLGKREISAHGCAVIPGFVDAHTHYDAQLTWDPLLSPSSSHGVTTVVMGNCGVGFAPARPEKRDWLIALMEGVEDIPGAAMAEGIVWEWERFPEYLDALSRKQFAVDVGTQVPHGPIRAYVMGERASDQHLATGEDISAMASLVAEGMKAGALGFSTSRTLLHKGRDGKHVPGTFAAPEEISAIAGAMNGGVLQLTTNHVQLPEELPWVRKVAEQTAVHAVVNLVQIDEAPDLWRDMMGVVSQARAEGVRLTAQIAGRPAGILMNLQGTAHPFLPVPSYLGVHFLPFEQRLMALRDPDLRARIIAEAPLSIGPFEDSIVSAHHKMFRLGDPPCYEPDPSASAAAIAARTGKSPREIVYDWLLEDEGRGVVYFPLFNFSSGHCDHLATLLQSDSTVIGLGDGGAHCATICDASLPSYLLAWWGRDRSRGRIPLERLVHQQCRKTALTWGLSDRGLLQPGYRADLNVVDLDALQIESPRLVFDLPAGGKRFVQGARGYRYTAVAGEITFEGGLHTGLLPGRLARGAR